MFLWNMLLSNPKMVCISLIVSCNKAVWRHMQLYSAYFGQTLDKCRCSFVLPFQSLDFMDVVILVARKTNTLILESSSFWYFLRMHRIIKFTSWHIKFLRLTSSIIPALRGQGLSHRVISWWLLLSPRDAWIEFTLLKCV